MEVQRNSDFNEYSHVLFTFIYQLCVNKDTCHGAHMQFRRQLTGVGSFFFHHVGIGDWTQISGLTSRWPLTCWPKIPFFIQGKRKCLWVLLKWGWCNTGIICLVILIRSSNSGKSWSAWLGWSSLAVMRWSWSCCLRILPFILLLFS